MLGFACIQLPALDFPINYPFDTSEPLKFNFQITELTFLGLISLIDPPKVTVPSSIRACSKAGIKVIMVTGDSPTTALTIARQVNIVPENVKSPEEIQEEH